ncbi:MAG: hypothetical protein DLM67_03315 [Candidatus Nephthysia bennettiae]|nr:MAG: hypothetical protein DLM67_03315 [Candidatus Dormibacteraeota bacterium]
MEVRRTADAIHLDFSGEAARQVVVVPLGLLGAADPEQEEMRLLAQLRRMGYHTSHQPPET